MFHLHIWEMSLIRIHIPHSRDKIIIMIPIPYMVNLMAGLETSMREALVPFHKAATPS